MDDPYHHFRDSTTFSAAMKAQRLLAATVKAQADAQRLLVAQIEAMRRADLRHVQLPPRLERLFRPRRGQTPRLSQGLGPSSPPGTAETLAPAPHIRRGRGRPPGSYDSVTVQLEAEFPEWYEQVRRMKGRGPTLPEAAQHWGIDRKTVTRTLKRHPQWSRQFPMYKKRPKRL